MDAMEAEARRAVHERRHAADLAGEGDPFERHMRRYARAARGEAPADPVHGLVEVDEAAVAREVDRRSIRVARGTSF